MVSVFTKLEVDDEEALVELADVVREELDEADELDEDEVRGEEVVVAMAVVCVDGWLNDEVVAAEEEVEDGEVVDFVEEANREYPPAPAAITIITIATITAAVLLIARLFLIFIPIHQMTRIFRGCFSCYLSSSVKDTIPFVKLESNSIPICGFF